LWWMTIDRQQFGEHHLKARTVELQWTSIAEQQFANHQTEWPLTVRGGGLYLVLLKLYKSTQVRMLNRVRAKLEFICRWVVIFQHNWFGEDSSFVIHHSGRRHS
jgi:hypothetical protein